MLSRSFGICAATGPASNQRFHQPNCRKIIWRNAGGLILHNPPALRQMILRQFGWWNLWLLAGPVAAQIPKDLDSIDNAKRAQTPAIFLLAESDEIVAPRFHRLVV